MIEREFIAQKTKEYYIKKYLEEKLKGVGVSQIKLKKIPLGEKQICQYLWMSDQACKSCVQ